MSAAAVRGAALDLPEELAAEGELLPEEVAPRPLREHRLEVSDRPFQMSLLLRNDVNPIYHVHLRDGIDDVGAQTPLQHCLRAALSLPAAVRASHLIPVVRPRAPSFPGAGDSVPTRFYFHSVSGECLSIQTDIGVSPF
jgi:hypothetical protein